MDNKKELIKKIEEQRKSKVITYITSDRQGPVNARVAMDIIPYVKHAIDCINSKIFYSEFGW